MCFSPHPQTRKTYILKFCCFREQKWGIVVPSTPKCAPLVIFLFRGRCSFNPNRSPTWSPRYWSNFLRNHRRVGAPPKWRMMATANVTTGNPFAAWCVDHGREERPGRPARSRKMQELKKVKLLMSFFWKQTWTDRKVFLSGSFNGWDSLVYDFFCGFVFLMFLFVEEFLCRSFHCFQNSSQNLVESKNPVPKNTSDVPVAEVVSALAPTPWQCFFWKRNHHPRKEKTVWVFLNMNYMVLV